MLDILRTKQTTILIFSQKSVQQIWRNFIIQLASTGHSLNTKKFTVYVLYFRTLIACQKSLDKECRPRSGSSLIRVFPVCYSVKHFFLNSSPDNQHLIENRKRKFRNFRILTVNHFNSLPA